MQKHLMLPEIDFGQPEAEHDAIAIERSFYEADSWKTIVSGRGMPFIVGRKGSGKSAIAARLAFIARQKSNCTFLRIVPSDFRHVEIRDLLACLVNKSTSWQYIYKKVWEGIILGQIVNHFAACLEEDANHLKISRELGSEVERFQRECGFYVGALSDTLADVITKYVRDAAKKTDALSQVELRKMLEPYNWNPLLLALQHQFEANSSSNVEMFIAIDGLDEHWDTSAASLYFLAQLLSVAKDFTAKFGSSAHIVICLRDNIFRALVDTKSIEYDKIESLIVNLEWSSRSLFELIARRVEPHHKLEFAISGLKDLLPESVYGMSAEEFIGRHVLQRPRDYINFFRMLQKECGTQPRAGEGHVLDTVAKYCANRLVDLENEFGFTYPGISKCIAALHALPEVFTKEVLVEALKELILTPSFRESASGLVASHGQPVVLARILVSIGVIGIYDAERHALRFIHEFSESRVCALWDAATGLGIHPVYRYKTVRLKPPAPVSAPSQESIPAIITDPVDYLAEKDSHLDLENHKEKFGRKREDLIAELASIDSGQAHYRRFESWVNGSLSLCFIGDLLNGEEQIRSANNSKIFELIFDIISDAPPWHEIKNKYETHRLLVECKNTDEPTDADFSKLTRDMAALDVRVAFMAYRGKCREPKGKVFEHQRAAYINSNRKQIIITLSEVFLLQCLNKSGPEKCRNNLNSLWRDSVQRWLTT